MPLYDYRCRDCDDRFEVKLGFDERPATVPCPSGHPNTVRIFSPVGVVTGRASAAVPSQPAMPAAGGCGSACGCHHG